MSGTIIDSNVIIDIVEPGSAWTPWAKRMIADARLQGSLVFNVLIAAEVAHAFISGARYRRVFEPPLWTFDDIPFEAGLLAGQAHRDYRARGGVRDRTLPDFLIGAHALVAGHRLLTRDAARYRTYFPDLEIVAPDTHP
ncbi:type II toxin-antitoxin system VapC family toxin [Mesorhizobium sp. CAU 1732]|uniref:type II toxin-antitoxin system VapC family toxin n=1 Tax=Mesorhizobium sp. CAU 1732 TaxID=3140358 RepID=UPI0032609FCD